MKPENQHPAKDQHPEETASLTLYFTCRQGAVEQNSETVMSDTNGNDAFSAKR